MASTSTNDSLHWLLLKASLRAKQQLVGMAEENDLTVMQVYTLMFLEPSEPVPMNSISILLSCDPSNVTGIVDKLVAAEYIERHENAADRRIKDIALTAKGVAFRQSVFARLAKHDVPATASLSKTEAETLKNLLLKTFLST